MNIWSQIIKKIKFKIANKIKTIVYWAENVCDTENKLILQSNLKFCGEGVFFHGKLKIVYPENVELHKNVIIGNNAYIDGKGGISIGENTHISRNFVAHSSMHNYHGQRLPYDHIYQLRPVKIGRNVWIGTNVVILPGIEIGEGAIIGAGAVVTKSIPAFAIVGNQPIRTIKHRDVEHYKKLDSQRAYSGISGKAL